MQFGFKSIQIFVRSNTCFKRIRNIHTFSKFFSSEYLFAFGISDVTFLLTVLHAETFFLVFQRR